MKNEPSAFFWAKVNEAHELMLKHVSKIGDRSDGIGNRDDAKESKIIERWADVDVMNKDLAGQ